ncbi:MAG: hypothetical protein AAF125_12355, partial [Chloroflexota bacterium]
SALSLERLDELVEDAKADADRDGRYQEDLQHYQELRERWGGINRNVLWYCDWGCAVVTLVDCNTSDMRVYSTEPIFSLKLHSAVTLREWWRLWLEDRLSQD